MKPPVWRLTVGLLLSNDPSQPSVFFASFDFTFIVFFFLAHYLWCMINELVFNCRGEAGEPGLPGQMKFQSGSSRPLVVTLMVISVFFLHVSTWTSLKVRCSGFSVAVSPWKWGRIWSTILQLPPTHFGAAKTGVPVWHCSVILS